MKKILFLFFLGIVCYRAVTIGLDSLTVRNSFFITLNQNTENDLYVFSSGFSAGVRFSL